MIAQLVARPHSSCHHKHTHMTRHRHRLLNRKWLFLLSLFMILRALATISCLISFILGAYNQDVYFLYISGGCLALFLILQMFHSLENSKIVCPNCRSQIMLIRSCAKHRDAKKLFGSYSLRLALQVVFTKAFRCQYCFQKYQWRGKISNKSVNQKNSNL